MQYLYFFILILFLTTISYYISRSLEKSYIFTYKSRPFIVLYSRSATWIPESLEPLVGRVK